MRFAVIALTCLWAIALLPSSTSRAQTALPAVQILAVDDSDFPNLRLSTRVVGADGLPATGLTAANFSLVEETGPVPIGAVASTPVQAVDILFVLDRSTDPASWTTIQAAVDAAIDALQPAARAGVTVFFDEVQLVQGFSDDRAALKAALAQVDAGGEFSAVNPALLDAADRVAGATGDARAIVLVADVVDNTSGVSAEQVIQTLQNANVPVFMVGFGPRVAGSADFAAIAAASGGSFIELADAAAVQPILTSLVEQLQLGYEVVATSNVVADGQAHDFNLQVDFDDGVASASGTYEARSREVTVNLSGLVANQPIGGEVELFVEVLAPSAVANIVFRVDGDAIGTSDSPTVPVIWDTSTAAPGPHDISVEVVDEAGNSGSAAVRVEVIATDPVARIRAIESSELPQISIYVDVLGANGLPVVGLGKEAFDVTEDGIRVAPETVSVLPDASQPIHYVLVLDRSLEVGEWAQVRSAANILVDAMRPQDTMAVYAFANSSQLVQPGSSDGNAIKAAIATVEPLVPAPDVTGTNALYQATLDAVNLAGTMPEGRRLVVALTGEGDDTRAISLGEMVDVLMAQPIPVHIYGFGPNLVAGSLLAGLAQLTGGNAVIVNRAADLRPNVQTVAALMQQGYRLDYVSTLPADDLAHDVAVVADVQGGEVAAATQMIAVRRPILVTVPNVADGDTIAGAVNLTAVAEAPVDIVDVEYRLNGEVLAQVQDIESSIIWNSDTVEPGLYTLDVAVTDRAGNVGTAQLTFTVVAPITVAARLGGESSDGNVPVGDSVTIDVDADAFAGNGVSVQVLVDQVQVGTDSQPPYQIVFETGRFGPGDHEVMIRAVDDAGYEASTVVPLFLVAPPTPTPAAVAASLVEEESPAWGAWLRYVGIALVLLGLIGVVLFLLQAYRRAQAAPAFTPVRLVLSNMGNMASAYLLRGEDPSNGLTFQFSIAGTRLGRPPVARAEGEASVNGGRGLVPGLPTNVRLPQSVRNIPRPTSLSDVTDKVQEVSGVARIIADLLVTFAMFLPRNLSSPIRRIAGRIRRTTMAGRRLEYAQRRIDRLNQSELGSKMVKGSKELASEVGEVAQAPETQEAVQETGQTVATTVAATTATTGQRLTRAYELTTNQTKRAVNKAYALTGGNGGGVTRSGKDEWVYVPVLEPGEAVTIDIIVGLQKPGAGTQHYPFRLVSKAVEDESSRPMVEQGSVQIAGPSWWRRNLLMLLLGGGFVVIVLIILLLFVVGVF